MINGINEKEWIRSLGEVKKILDRSNIKYWLDQGTLLGAVRDGKFITKDTDIDIGTTYEEAKKIIEVVPELEKKGYKVSITDFAIYLSKLPIAISICFYRFKENKAWTLNGIITPKYFNNLLKYFDLVAERLLYKFLYKEKNIFMKFIFFIFPFSALKIFRKLLFQACELLGQKYCAFIVPKSCFDNLDKVVFYGMNFNIPSFSEKYFTLFYGKNWRIPNPNWYRENIITGSHIKTTRKLDCSFFEKYDRSKYSLI